MPVNLDKHNGALWCQSPGMVTLVVAISCKLFGEKVVGQHARLGQAVDIFAYLKVDPVMMGESCEVVLFPWGSCPVA